MNNPTQQWQEEWKDIEPETIEHLMTVLDVYAHVGQDEQITNQSYKQACEYIDSWVKYRSQHVRTEISSAYNRGKEEERENQRNKYVSKG